jgi:alpha/beta superfamily hydrolase
MYNTFLLKKINYYMNIFANYNHPGKHIIMLDGEVGELEVELIIPEEPKFNFCAIIGHPHSLHGGTMHNKVVTTVATTFQNLNIPTIKFNFRGVGRSNGQYDAGIGESLDMLVIARLWQDLYPNAHLVFIGFSFGSFVTYRAACISSVENNKVAALISIAPSVENYNYNEFSGFDFPWLVIQGDKDEIVDPESVYSFVKSYNPPLNMLVFSDTTHFFHGKLIELKTKLAEYLLENIV